MTDIKRSTMRARVSTPDDVAVTGSKTNDEGAGRCDAIWASVQRRRWCHGVLIDRAEGCDPKTARRRAAASDAVTSGLAASGQRRVNANARA